MMIPKSYLKPFLSTRIFSDPKILNQIKEKEYVISSLKYTFSEENNNKVKKQNSSIIPYVPIRPLKKHLTALYVNNKFLNQGQIPKKISLWPYLIPFYGLVCNNFLTSWTLINSIGAFSLFVLGIALNQFSNLQRTLQIVKFQCNSDLSKFYMTVLDSAIAKKISQQYPQNFQDFQDWGVFSVEDQGKYEYVLTQIEKKTLSQQQIQQKKIQFENNLLGKIRKQYKIQDQIKRFELDGSKTKFILSNVYKKRIRQGDLLHKVQPLKSQQMFNVDLKYLIVKTQFIHKRSRTPLHFFITLQSNGDQRYQDYLIALGKNYKIALNDYIK